MTLTAIHNIMIGFIKSMFSYLETAQKIKETLAGAQRILLVGHQQPDGDALGSLISLAYYLKSLAKDYRLFCLDQPSAQYQFLPLIHEVSSDPELFNQPWDTIMVLDSGDLKYAGIEGYLKKTGQQTIINIDHHVSNNFFGDLNLVLTGSSSTSEVVYELFRLWNFGLNKDLATALLSGIVFDTGNFTNAGTTLNSLKIAAQLLNLGARQRLINYHLLKNRSLGLLKLWGRAFLRLEFKEPYQLAVTFLTLRDFEECGVDPETAGGLSNFFNELAGARIILVLTEIAEGLIKGSLRTTSDEVDVAKLAAIWGGGGHAKAAGFTIAGRLVYNEGRWEII